MVHNFILKTMFIPSSPENWRMITRQQQQANHQKALDLPTTHQAILHAPRQGQNPTHNKQQI